MGLGDVVGSLARGTMDIVNPVGAATKTVGHITDGVTTGDWDGLKGQMKDDLSAGLLLGGVAATVASGGAAAPAVAGAAGTATAAEGAVVGTAAATTAGRVGLGQVAGQVGKGVAKKVATSYAKDAALNLLNSGNGHSSGQGYVGPVQGAPGGGAVQPQGPSFQDVVHGAGGIIGSAVNAAQPQTSGWGANDGS